MSKITNNVGDKYEQQLSLELHKSYIPVLISSKLLRTYSCGQVDISYINNSELTIVEAKSSTIGLKVIASGWCSQKRRLWNTVSFLESLLEIPVHLKFIAKR